MPPRKRTRQVIDFGAPSQADRQSLLQQNDSVTSLTACSERRAPGQVVSFPTLAGLSCKTFAASVETFFPPIADMHTARSISKLQKRIGKQLKNLPDHLLKRVFNALKVVHPTKLSRPFIAEYFMRGDTIQLTGDMPGVTKSAVAEVVKAAGQLTMLELSGLTNVADEVFASVINKCKHLQSLILRGSTKVAGKTAAAIAYCVGLKILNLNYTSTPAPALDQLILACPNLEVLKLAALPNFTDHALAKLLASIAPKEGGHGSPPLSKLRSLKLRLNSGLSELHLAQLLSLASHLTRLDLASTGVRRLPLQTIPILPLEKLSLTSTDLNFSDLVNLLGNLPHLRKLGLAALGVGKTGKQLSSGTFNDTALSQVTEVLHTTCPDIEDINLGLNAKLGSGPSGPLRDFIAKVGRRCKILNLSHTALTSYDLWGLVGDQAAGEDAPIPPPPLLETLNLSNTKIDDEGGFAIASCSSLEVLEVAATQLTRTSLFQIISACPMLHRLDLTSNRGIKVTERRCFFEVWEREA